MTRADYNQNAAYTAAIALSPQLVRIAEELPVHEQTGLMMQLHQAMVDLPTMIALDITRAGDGRFAAWLRLGATLDLIDQVYPALDAAGVRADLDKLGQQLSAPGFATATQAALAATVSPSAPEAAPAQAETPEPTTVTVTPEETSVHVQPDSVQ